MWEKSSKRKFEIFDLTILYCKTCETRFHSLLDYGTISLPHYTNLATALILSSARASIWRLLQQDFRNATIVCRFLQEIEQHFWSNLYLTEIAKITANYASNKFEVYVRYVQNQVYQDRVLTDLQ